MPPQLLSPAGFPAAFGVGGASSSQQQQAMSTSFLEDRRSLQVPAGGAVAGPSSTMSRAAGRPGLKRTASTASVNGQVMDMLNPRNYQQQQSQYVDSDDEEGGSIGVQEDWEVEEQEHDPFAASTSSNSPTPSGSGHSWMVLDSPTSSPTLMTQSQRRVPGKSAATKREMDNQEDNPFLASNGPPKAPRKKQNAAQRNPDKVSYVFRGKRITYDAPLESLFPADDEDDMSLPYAKSGPRVLFPSPPTPSASTSALPPSQNVSPPSSSANVNLLMQTPRRAPPPAALTTPAERITAALDGERAKRGGKDAGAPKAPFIPPTPASLPQKSKAEKTLERERLAGAMRGIQATNAAAAASHRGESAEARGRRYAPYPPR